MSETSARPDVTISLGDLRSLRENMTGGDWEIVVDRNGQQNLREEAKESAVLGRVRR